MSQSIGTVPPICTHIVYTYPKGGCMIATTRETLVAIALNDEETDNAYVMIPNERRYSQVLPKFLADYGLDVDHGGRRITIPGPMAEEKAREYAALLNKRVDDFIAGTGSTMSLQPRPIIQLPSLVFYPINIRISRVFVLRALGVIAAVFAIYWLVVGMIYLGATTSTTDGPVAKDHNFGIYTDDQLTVHVSVNRQYVIRNFRTIGMVLPQGCRTDEKPDGQTLLMCGTSPNEVPVVSLPELRAHQPGTTYWGRTLDYPATVDDIPDEELEGR
ncbi:MAG: hypothetical protein RI947_1528 [Candidatus Parcubacteria bacterium]|jgi:hypothetical protein